MVGYGEELAARQGANVEAYFGDLDAEVSDPSGFVGSMQLLLALLVGPVLGLQARRAWWQWSR
jgi:hypothetical protein